MEEEFCDRSKHLPEEVCRALRVDVGLPAQNEDRDEGQQTPSSGTLKVPKPLPGSSANARRSSLSLSLYFAFHDRLAMGGVGVTQMARRAARLSRIVVALRALSVTEPELHLLTSEVSAEALKGSKTDGPIFVGGAARVAQSILFPNPAVKMRQLKAAPQMDPRRSSKLGGPVDQKQELPDTGQGAKAIVQASRDHQTRCYNSAGYDQDGGRNRTAVALQFLEHELFTTPGDSSNAKAINVRSHSWDEETLSLLPVLFSESTATSLKAQLLREEAARKAAEIAAAAAAEAKMAAQAATDDKPSHRRRGAIMFQEPPDLEGSTTSTSESEETSVCATNSRPVGARLSNASSRSDRAFSRMSPKRSLNPSPAQRAFGIGILVPRGAYETDGFARRGSLSRQSSTMISPPPVEHPRLEANALSGAMPAELEVPSESQVDLSQWPASVRGLFDSVSTSSVRLQKSGLGFRSAAFKQGLMRCETADRELWPSLVAERLPSSPSLALSGKAGPTMSLPVMTMSPSLTGLGQHVLQSPPQHEPLLQLPPQHGRSPPPKRGGHINELSRRCASSPALQRGASTGMRKAGGSAVR